MAYTTINKGSSYFNTVTYTGNGSTQSITGVGFKPDWVWTKSRANAYNHQEYDAVRGATNYMLPNLTNAEATNSTTLTAFNVDGFTLGSGDNSNQTNGSTAVAWNWLGANSTASNTNGSITSTISANQTAGFSIVSFTGTGSNATVGHGLGVTPSMFILKNRSVGPNDWYVYHTTLGATQSIFLDLTNTPSTGSSYWNNTSPTSSVFSIGTNSGLNGSGNSIIAYCFASIKGFSKFSSYTGNGSTDGTFVYTGFKPAFIMTKSYSGYTGYWTIFDSTRSPTNTGSTAALWANVPDAEGTYPFDILSNGFKIRTTSATLNQSGAGYIYMAFASNPFVTSGGIPVTAR